MRSLVLLLLSLTVLIAGCASGPKPLPKPDGTVFRFNPDKWGETTNDLREARQ